VKKVLVVDDSETIRQQVGRALEQAGFSVVEASDGIEGLDRLAQHEFSMVILDVNMPRLNGLDLLDRLKADPKTAEIPVLMLTTEAHQAMIERAKKAGAKGWIIKPVKMELLVSAVNKLARAA
jgi:two-component system chemotaxis response regulator CheY